MNYYQLQGESMPKNPYFNVCWNLRAFSCLLCGDINLPWC